MSAFVGPGRPPSAWDMDSDDLINPPVPVPDRSWRGCRMVNPLCPDDLCCLPLDHPPGEHLLMGGVSVMTPEEGAAWPVLDVPWSMESDSDGLFVMMAYSKTDIISEGARLQKVEAI